MPGVLTLSQELTSNTRHMAYVLDHCSQLMSNAKKRNDCKRSNTCSRENISNCSCSQQIPSHFNLKAHCLAFFDLESVLTLHLNHDFLDLQVCGTGKLLFEYRVLVRLYLQRRMNAECGSRVSFGLMFEGQGRLVGFVFSSHWGLNTQGSHLIVFESPSTVPFQRTART